MGPCRSKMIMLIKKKTEGKRILIDKNQMKGQGKIQHVVTRGSWNKKLTSKTKSKLKREKKENRKRREEKSRIK